MAKSGYSHQIKIAELLIKTELSSKYFQIIEEQLSKNFQNKYNDNRWSTFKEIVLRVAGKVLGYRKINDIKKQTDQWIKKIRQENTAEKVLSEKKLSGT